MKTKRVSVILLSIMDIKTLSQNFKLADILMLNPYEKLVPYNLWFEHPDYSIVHESTRIRLWRGVALTLVFGHYDTIPRSISDHMTVYQPFYPEQFYQIYGILSERGFSTNKVLAICHEPNLGCLEAVIIWHEKHYDTKGQFEYLCPSDYLTLYGASAGQTLDEYDLILIDLMPKQSSICEPVTDLTETVACYEKYSKKCSAMIIRCSLAQKINIQGEIIRSDYSHPWNPECYLIPGDTSNYDEIRQAWLPVITTKPETKNFPYLSLISQLRTIEPQDLEEAVFGRHVDSSKISLEQAKLELNHVKRVMDTKPTETHMTWENVTHMLSISRRIKNIMSKKVKHCTNAWLKCWELVIQYELFRERCFHICEAPGAFILACQYYANLKRVNYEWFAQTLHSKVDGALEDHFGIIANNPDRWLFNGIGDITSVDTIKSYAHIKPDFMTADGGVACDKSMLNDYETVMNPLLLGQIACVLTCLNKEGSAIIKAFLPMANKQTISLVYALVSCFDTITMTKPVTSHDCNSEIYLVAKGYRGIEQKTLEAMYQCLEKQEPYIEPWTPEFYQAYEAIVTRFIERQIISLQSHYAVYYDQTRAYKLYPAINRAVDRWFANNRP